VCPRCWLLLAALAATPGIAAEAPDVPRAASAVPGAPADVLAEAPTDLSVTVYRAAARPSGSIDLDALQGFALVSETRAVHLPAGESRVRFEGVADGIEPASAIITGLDEGVLEKNRDASLLSPSALVAAAVGKAVVLTRTNPKTGSVQSLPGTILSDAQGGVVFKTAQGIEALRCSGLPETFSFEPATGLASRPTLSVLVRTRTPLSARVTLSYLAGGFDWAADYSATVSADGKSMDLGAWVTLANGNGVGFPEAHTQVVAGRVNHESGAVEPIETGGAILASCWPRGSTSDFPMLLQYAREFSADEAKDRVFKKSLEAPPPAPLAQVAAAAQRVTQEQLGDLKLYRVPNRTTVASRQSKQVRLLDRSGIPIAAVYGAELADEARPEKPGDGVPVPAVKYLRTRNNAASHLGVPLPSGSVAVFGLHGGQRLLEHESGVRDLAVDEEVEINMGESPDVEVTATRAGDSHRVQIANARAAPIDFELTLRLPEGTRVVSADRAMTAKNGRPIFKFEVPAQSTLALEYRTKTAGR
jgi:hypothetical protein